MSNPSSNQYLSEYDEAMNGFDVPRVPLQVYDSNSYRRVGIRNSYSVVMWPTKQSDGHPDITPDQVLRALVAAFNAMLALRGTVYVGVDLASPGSEHTEIHEVRPAVETEGPRERMYSGVGHLEATGYIPAGSAAERETEGNVARFTDGGADGWMQSPTGEFVRYDDIKHLLHAETTAPHVDTIRLDFMEVNGLDCLRLPTGDSMFSVWLHGVRHDGQTPREAIDKARGAVKAPCESSGKIPKEPQ